MNKEIIEMSETGPGSHFSKEEKYWLDKLAPTPEKCHLPYDYPSAGAGTDTIDTLPFHFDPELLEKILKLSGDSNPKLYMILTAGLIALLYKYTGIKDIVTGTSIFKQAGDAQFINTVLALRNNVEDHTTFKQLLLQVRQTIIEADENQNFPIEMLLRELKIPYSLGDDFPLFDVVLVLQNIHRQEYLVDIRSNMLFSFNHHNGTINGVLQYRAALYDKETINWFVQHYTRLLKHVLSDVDLKLSWIDILSQEEKEQLTVDFNNTLSPYPGEKVIPLLFEEQVEKSPQAIAVVSENNRLSYRQLNEKANRWAWRLREKGLKCGELAAIVMHRSDDVIAAILGILKAGGAYFCIDAQTPENRVVAMLNDSRAPFLLIQNQAIERFSYSALQGLHREGPLAFKSPPCESIADLDTLPFPDRSLVNYEKYNLFIGQAMAKNCISIQATRGCPYNCLYCHKIWPKKHVRRSPENLFREIQLYYNIGVRRFAFVDDIFNLDIKSSTRFFQLIIQDGMDVQLFFPNGIRGDILTPEYIDLMVQAGTVNLAVALESTSPRLQKLLRKNLNLKKLRENIEYFVEKYPHVILELFTIHGFPTETEEEAQSTLDFIKSMPGIHFPYVFLLKIYPDTDMADLAITHGESLESIYRSENLAFHQLPETLPFKREFTMKYQAQFTEFFLSKERLLKLLPRQLKILTPDEIIQKYDSYLDVDIKEFSQLLELVGITEEELQTTEYISEQQFFVPHLNRKLQEAFPRPDSDEDATRVLLLDLSQSFSQRRQMIYDVVDPPLGLMYILTYLEQQMPGRVNGKIAKSRIDFDNYHHLENLIKEFKPHVIGIRALSFDKDFLHKTVGMIRQWGISVPLIIGGPYATSSYKIALQDRDIDLAVLGEGEKTFCQLVKMISGNNGKLPGPESLKEVSGIAFIEPESVTPEHSFARDLLAVDHPNGSRDLGEDPIDNPEIVNQPHDLAYMIYTSGSTGTPKGVLVEHRNLNNLVFGLKERIYGDYGDNLRVCQVSPFVFDASVKQIFAALLLGHTLYIAPEEIRINGTRLLEFYRKHRIDVSDGTPAHIRMMVESAAESEIELPVKHFIIGGEALPKPTVENFLNKFKRTPPRITNIYGPAECCVDSTSFEITKRKIPLLKNIPIGVPMPNVQVYIMDPGCRLKPIGAAGEICISGRGVGRGYLRREELTKERFGINPFKEGERLYRSGDLGRWLPDGNIEFLGRVDEQVKIRGYRIEPEEIRKQLLTHPGIKEAVVTAVKGIAASTGKEADDYYLCAYFVPDLTGSNNHPDARELKEYLSANLPYYMIPWHFIPLDRLPLTPNGKVDKNALPEPHKPENLKTGDAPIDQLGKEMAGLWSEILRIERDKIGLGSHFIELGGHSLKVFSLVSRIHKEFNVNLPMTGVFETPILKDLVEKIKTSITSRYISIKPVEKKDYYPLSSAQSRLYVLWQMDPGNVAYNTPKVVPLEEDFDMARMEEAFRKLIRRHESLKTMFTSISDVPVQKICDRVDFEIEYIEAEPAEVKFLVNNFVRPFDLEVTPLMRAGLITIASDTCSILVVDMHHIVSDGISHGILVNDFMALYAGETIPTLKLRYKDYSEWLNATTGREGAVTPQEQYWLEEFKGNVPLLNLPTDFYRPKIKSSAGSSLTLELEDEKTVRLKKLALEEDVTLFMVVLALYFVFLAKISGQDDIVIGTPVAGRNHVDLEQIIGLFINTLALRNYPVKRKTFVQFLREVRKRTLDAFDNQDYLFEDLVNNILEDRDPGRHPLFDVWFQLRTVETDTGDEEIRSENTLAARKHQYEYQNRISKYDLSLYAALVKDKLLFTFQYCTKLFQEDTIKIFSRYFKQIVSSVLENPEKPLCEIDVVSEKKSSVLRYMMSDDLENE